MQTTVSGRRDAFQWPDGSRPNPVLAVIALIIMAASSRRSTALVSLLDPPIAARWQALLMSPAMDEDEFSVTRLWLLW